MSIQPPELIDPYDRFWSAARDVSVDLTPQENEAIDRISTQGLRANTEAQMVLVLGGAFMVFRDIMARHLANQVKAGVTEPTILQLTVASVYQALVPAWL